MRIDRIELYHVAMPLIYPWRTAYGEDAAIESVLVKMTSGDEHGWGETAPFAITKGLHLIIQHQRMKHCWGDVFVAALAGKPNEAEALG